MHPEHSEQAQHAADTPLRLNGTKWTPGIQSSRSSPNWRRRTKSAQDVEYFELTEKKAA
jgi:hypothetical protein